MPDGTEGNCCQEFSTCPLACVYKRGAGRVGGSASETEHPLAHLAGKYDDEPLWDELQAAIRENRQKGDEMSETKTQEQVGELKNQWRADPCWDIETTEGFEAHRAELLKFRLDHEQEGLERESRRQTKKCEELGIRGNFLLLAYIEKLESRIETLQEQVQKL